MQLSGKVALVTGGGRGIGKAIALALSDAGADIGLLARTKQQVAAVASAVEASGRQACALECDVADAKQVESSVTAVFESLGRVDIVVNNAGGGAERSAVGDDDPTVWMSVIQANLVGTYLVSRAALPYLRNGGGGAIINVGSGMGHEARPNNSSYNAAKAGVWMLTRCLALELWKDNITVNELIPGPVYTELTEAIFEAGQPHPAIPSEWVKDPEDVVPLALFLACQGPKGPTGQSFSLARRPVV